MCWDKSCPQCCGCSWMDLVQPQGLSCPEDVCPVCVTDFIMVLLCTSPTVTSCSPSAQGTSSCPVPEPSLLSPCLALPGLVPQPRSALASSRIACFTTRNKLHIWQVEAGGIAAGRSKHGTPSLLGVHPEGSKLGVAGLLLVSQCGVCPVLALPAAARGHSSVPQRAPLGSVPPTACFPPGNAQSSGPGGVGWDGEQTPHLQLRVLGWDWRDLEPVLCAAPACWWPWEFPLYLTPGLFGEQHCSEAQQWFWDRLCPRALGEALTGHLRLHWW